MLDGKEITGWICQGSARCRAQNKCIQLYGNTSKATKHLSDDHFVTSAKVIAETGRKRSREEELKRISHALTNPDDYRRATLLLETLRVVNNNLPFRIGEYEESELLSALTMKEEFRATINTATVTHTFLADNKIPGVPTFAMNADFWLAKAQGAKFLGLRLYLIDRNYNYQSVLLGTRHFNPKYADRNAGIRGPFKTWITSLLRDFGLTTNDFFGATSDKGPDVRRMLESELKLKWEWCVPHLTNASTKLAFGIVSQRVKSKNLEMTDLISRISKTIYDVRSNEKLGSLFSELCTMIDPNATTRLLEYRDHRFMGLTRVVKRILEKYEELEIWYSERIEKALRERKTPPEDFPLVEDRQTLLQMYALLQPITEINTHSQSESANQPEVLGLLYKLRHGVLDQSQQLLDCFRNRNPPIYFRVHELTPLIKRTRTLLAKSFHENFFKRYTDSERISSSAFVPEMQMLLHPLFKNPDGHISKIVKLCCSQIVVDQNNPHLRMTTEPMNDNVTSVRAELMMRLKSLMTSVVIASEGAEHITESVQTSLTRNPAENALHSEGTAGLSILNDLVQLFGHPPDQARSDGFHEDRVKTEIQRWMSDRTSLLQYPGGATETLMEFWKRQCLNPRYQILPIVVRILFAIPVSAAQIERDFGVSGMMVTSHRTSLAKHNIDMCSFINRNRRFVDITKCPRMDASEVAAALPSSAIVRMGTEEISSQSAHTLIFGEDSDRQPLEDFLDTEAKDE
ncbi:hypothetical protein PHMEG_00028498 [Phytophthora megakarya]|uniref:HAT C-terminal dimerisation domain-containing protein n=1 Tax=Phytophthora megakarya TaxID=4795 RepID=A0A225V4T9_9STRA|nr:hypothetical protein PHMEG_00028498 [Phytophthora megakarya]